MFYAVIFADSRIADIAFFGLNKRHEPEDIISSKVCAFHFVLFSP